MARRANAALDLATITAFGGGGIAEIKVGLAGARGGDAGLVAGFDDATAADSAAAKACPIPNSFDPATPVLMADGTSRPIKDIKVGDKVTATDPVTGKTASEPVTQLHLNRDTDLTDLILSTTPVPTLRAILAPDTVTTGAASILHTTTHHPFWDATSQQWIAAGHLVPGHQLAAPHGQAQYVVAVHNHGGTKDMRNLTIAEIHTYYVIAGNVPVLVHNAPAYCGGSNLIGQAADDRFGQVLAKQYSTSQIQSQFEVWTPYGTRVADYAVEDGNGGYRLFEVKANGSRYTKVQQQKDAWISQNLGWDTTVIRMSQSCPLGC